MSQIDRQRTSEKMQADEPMSMLSLPADSSPRAPAANASAGRCWAVPVIHEYWHCDTLLLSFQEGKNGAVAFPEAGR